MDKTHGRSRHTILVLLFIGALTAAFFLSFLVGRYPISPSIVGRIILSRFFPIEPTWEPTLETVVLQVRLPRILLAILVGGSLSLSGASYQTLFKNPMVSPDILGVSAGAGFGAAMAMLRSGTWAEIQLSALTFGLLAVGLLNLRPSTKTAFRHPPARWRSPPWRSIVPRQTP